MPNWLPLSSSKGSSLWLLWIVVYQGIPLFRRIWKTPCFTKPHFKGSRLGPRSHWRNTYFIALFLTIPKLSFYFLQVFWLWINMILKLRPIWSGHPVCTVFSPHENWLFCKYIHIFFLSWHKHTSFVKQSIFVTSFTISKWLKKYYFT